MIEPRWRQTAESNALRSEAARRVWRAKSRRDLFREIAASNGAPADALVGTHVACDLLGLNERAVIRLTGIGELPIAARTPSLRFRRYRLSDMLALRARAREEAAA